MKLYNSDHNCFGLKVAVTIAVTKATVEKVSRSPKEYRVPFLSSEGKPALELENGCIIFSENSICRFLWEEAGKFPVSIKDSEWCEWECIKLQEALTSRSLQSTVLQGKPEKSADTLLGELLRDLDNYLEHHKNLSGLSEKAYGLADVIVWSAVYPLYAGRAHSTDVFPLYKHIPRWFNTLAKDEQFSHAVMQIPNDVLNECKVPLVSRNSVPGVAEPCSPSKQAICRTQSRAESRNEDEHGPTFSSEDIEQAFEAWHSNKNASLELQKKADPILPEKGKKNILITSALPYVNNVPHLGNIVGSVLSADVFARYCRLRNWNTLYICGTDEYGTATETKALELKITPREICDRFNKIHSDIYDWFNISFDHFGRTTTEKQTEIAQDIFLKLHANGYLCEEVVEQLFCNKCDRFLADRFVEGTCPFCAYEDARGDQCDLCSKLINPTELKEARCKLCKEAPVLRNSGHYFIDLPKLQPSFVKWYTEKTSGDAWTQTAKVITGAWIRDGLKPRCITRDLKWGTPVPVEGYRDKVFYVWFDAPIGYLSITANYTDQWEKWWKQPDDVTLYQFMAKDNVPFHGIVFPMTQLGTHEKYTTVDHLVAIEYLNYEDAKFSKSRGVGVFGNDAQDTGIPSDVWRFYLMYQRPENQDSSFCWADLQLKNNSELLNNLGNFVNRALTFLYNNFGGVVPELDLTEDDKVVIAKVSRQLSHYIGFMDKVRLRDSIRCILNISRIGNQYIQFHKPWELVKGTPAERLRSATIMGLCANVACLASQLIHPFMPETSEAMRKQLNIPMFQLGPHFVQLLKAGHQMNKPVPLFKKIEQATVEQLQKRFEGRQADPVKKMANGIVNHVAVVKAQSAGDTAVDVDELTKLVQLQGNKVRELKTAKADKSTIEKEVEVLLRLKKELAMATGQDSSTDQKQKRKKK
uniref:Methionine--tRNA ligase, cytoplasmic n=1 Tax=Ornithodoros turicata TaxID=34597 RepID=A0A2R5LNK0_9ACAR